MSMRVESAREIPSENHRSWRDHYSCRTPNLLRNSGNWSRGNRMQGTKCVGRLVKKKWITKDQPLPAARIGMVTEAEAASDEASIWQRPSKIPPGSITIQGE